MKVLEYSLVAGNGNPVRRATKVVFDDGRELRFMEKMPKKLALSLAADPAYADAIKHYEPLRVVQSWDDKTVKADKAHGRGDGIYPDSVLWGMSINGICNPTVKIALEEIAKAIQAARS